MSFATSNRAPWRARPTCVVTVLALFAALVWLLAPAGAEAKPPRSFYGVTTQATPSNQDFAKMASGGVGSLRTMLSWSNVELVPDAPTWTEFDLEVLGAAEQGIRTVPFVYTTPAWVVEELDGRDCSSGCVQYAPRTPAAIAEWKEFLTEAVGRYGPGGTLWANNPEVNPLPIRTWQISNEQNSPKYFPPKPNVNVYAKVLKAAGEAIHGASPQSDVVVGGMFGTPFGGTAGGINSWVYLRKLYRIKGIKPAFDGVAIHPYAETLNLVEAQVKLARSEILRAKDKKVDLWITEIGWASAGPRSNWLVTTPKGQAARLRQAFDLFERKRKAWNVRAVFWYSWRDLGSPGICIWCPFSGLFTQDLKPKKSWRAFKQIAG